MDKIKVRVSVSTRMVGSEVYDDLEFEKEDWDSMSDEEKDKQCMEALFDLIDWNYQVEGE